MPASDAYCGILLVAGQATRFGGQKLLATLPNGEAMAVASARTLRRGLQHVVAVVRAEDTVLARLLACEGLDIVVNPNAARGMGTSIACGVRATADAPGWIIALGDMPYVHPQTLTRLSDQMRHGALIAMPRFRGRRGHPVAFGRHFGTELSSLDGDTGARDIIARHHAVVTWCDVDDPGVIHDIDTPAMLQNHCVTV